MQKNKPSISFTFPYRWLTGTEEKKYLKKNLLAAAGGGSVNQPMHPDLLPDFIASYRIVLRVHAYQPVKIPLTQTQLSNIFDDMFPGAKLIHFETFFVQRTSRTLLPVMELEIYY